MARMLCGGPWYTGFQGEVHTLQASGTKPGDAEPWKQLDWSVQREEAPAEAQLAVQGVAPPMESGGNTRVWQRRGRTESL